MERPRAANAEGSALTRTAGLLGLTAMGSFSDAHECPEIPVIAANLHRLILPRQSQIWAVLRRKADAGAARAITQAQQVGLGARFLGGDGIEGLAAMGALNMFGVRRLWPYLVAAVFLWLAVLASGVHATIAGVLAALMIPLGRGEPVSPLKWLEHRIHPWVMFGVVPLFGFVSAGVEISGLDALLSPLPLAIAAGLFVGKQLGVFGAIWIAVRTGLCQRPVGASWAQVYGAAPFPVPEPLFGRVARLPGIDGVEATRQLAGPGVEDPMAVVIITTFDLDEYVHGALKAGARGFLLKDAGPELLVQAIHAAANGDALISPDITRRLLTTLAGLERSAPPPQPIEPLTEREEEVLLTVARGRTNAEIADELHITLSTVKTHVGALMNKLGARNRVEVAMWAHETGRI